MQPPDACQPAKPVPLHMHTESCLAEVEALQVGDGTLVLDDNDQALRLAHVTILVVAEVHGWRLAPSLR